MLDKETFHPLNYIKKEEYSGSMDGMRYMLKRVKDADGGADKIQVTIWPEPFGIHATPDEKKIIEHFALDEDGVSDAADWINKIFFDKQDIWHQALEKGLMQ